MAATPPRALSDAQGVSLGRYLHGPENFGERLIYGGERNILLFGPNGSGKGTRFLMPNLLQMRDCSMVVIDPKGELAAVTAPYRRELHGKNSVVIINPFGVLTDIPDYEDLKSVGYNPLRALDPLLPSFNAEAAWLAEALITVQGNDPHWSLSARKLISALIMYAVLEDGDKATLGEVRRLLTEPSVAPDKAHPEGLGLVNTARKMFTSPLPALRMKAGQFTEINREIQSIVSTADTQTEALDDAEIAADLAKPGFDFRELKKRPITVYLILPPDMMERHGRWLRLILSSALRGVMRRREKGEMRVYFLMDEFAALGHLPIIETTWALVRGYGIQLVPVLQDLNQLKELYRDRWETFIGMAGVTAAFGPNDLTSAEWLSRRSGDSTEVVLGYNQSDGGPNTTQGISYHQTKVPRLTPHELFDTPEGHTHIWLAGMANRVPAYMPAWYEITTARERVTRDNPYFAGGS